LNLSNTENKAEKLRLLFESQHWSAEDRQWLLQYLDAQEQDDLRELMAAHFREDAETPVSYITEARLLAQIHQKTGITKAPKRLLSLARLSVAASIIVVLGTGIWLWRSQMTDGRSQMTGKKVLSSLVNDAAPGRNNAVLTLADGRTITLDSAANGGLAEQGNIKVIKLNGRISYTNSGGAAANSAALMNTISTARGNQYQLVLADGSKVWLNAASSLRFPAAFTGRERKVEITGEAYFEIAPNAAMPFKVMANGAEINVLGTSFNVNAYTDETAVKTTLLEGSVRVSSAPVVARHLSSVLLSPGQQARLNTTGTVSVTTPADVTADIAWKEGYFLFDNTDLATLMRQVSRWYDVDVVFTGNITDDGFTGKVSRGVPLSRLLQVLELNDIHCILKGKTVIVKQPI
jgi:ferric-dicitrate binding protein FerR (iron transport regulator)